MIVVSAPYSPPGSGGHANLGAARKIEAVLGILSRIDPEIVLVNTAHNGDSPSPISTRRTQVGGREVTEITPPTLANRRLGKFLNVVQAGFVADTISAIGVPRLVWLYNGYAFESRLGKLLRRSAGCPVVLEFEDWHFSRGRGFNPKPVVDWLLWRSVMKHVSHTFAVNTALADRVRPLSKAVDLLPGVVNPEVAALIQERPPFCRLDGDACVVGYFGGLSVEKGADRVADLVGRLPPGFKVIVTGSGALASRFSDLQATLPAALEFHGQVDDKQLVQLIGRCDVLLNPHASIASMANGVFPFKVIEGVATGRLVISTPLPASGLSDVLKGVQIIGHEGDDLLVAVLNARHTYEDSSRQIRDGAAEAARLFGVDAVLSRIKAVCAEATN